MKNIKQCVVALALPCALALSAAPAGAITIGMVNTFEGGTAEGWHVMGQHTAPPVVMADGGPGGAGDGYLQLTSVGGGGPGSRLAINSGNDWNGDYLATGVTFIEFDARNFGATNLQLRLAFSTMSGGDYVVSTVAQDLQAGSDWTHLVFPVSVAALSGLNPAATLANVGDLRIFHHTSATFPPNVGVVASLGIDNISVSAVPEPGALALWAAGAALVVPLARRRMRKQAAGSVTEIA